MSFSFTSFFCSDTNEVREPNKRRRERKHTTDKGKCTGFFVLCSSSFHWLVSCFLHSFSPLQTSQWKKRTKKNERRKNKVKWNEERQVERPERVLSSFVHLFFSPFIPPWHLSSGSVFYLFCLFCSCFSLQTNRTKKNK